MFKNRRKPLAGASSRNRTGKIGRLELKAISVSARTNSDELAASVTTTRNAEHCSMAS